MLLRFGLSNYLSIGDYQELSFAASKLQDNASHLMHIENQSIGTADYLPVVALYGANAAGKSNFLIGLSACCQAVKKSYGNAKSFGDDLDRRKFVGYRPCFATHDGGKNDSHFDIDFLMDGVRYHYGFEVGKAGYVREWLYAYPKKARQIIFIRDFGAEGDPFDPGPAIRTKLDPTLRSLAADQSFLFLSAAGSLNNAVLAPIAQYFSERVVFLHNVEEANELAIADQIRDDRVKQFVIKFLEAADSGIVDIEVAETPRSEKQKQVVAGVLGAIGKALKELDPDAPELPLNNREVDYSIQFVHEGPDGRKFKLGMGMESSGTLHLLSILAPVLSALEKGHALIIDEITTSLHTMVSQELIKLFSDSSINKANAQFVFSTHDTNLLSSDMLRRDEIWFTEKDGDGSTHLYPLTDFKTRKGDNIEKGYLQGRFGAIPYFGDVAALLGHVGRD
ncbi:AAA family ATPase [Burkholderia stagnalis]|uniref:AAA family ATPase n=1 Tax=Burkholderia stagnalis TaxID=1503054 RepID=UPI0009BE4ACF|nr:ATP-binding protein [Burkholderia stagnalis]